MENPKENPCKYNLKRTDLSETIDYTVSTPAGQDILQHRVDTSLLTLYILESRFLAGEICRLHRSFF